MQPQPQLHWQSGPTIQSSPQQCSAAATCLHSNQRPGALLLAHINSSIAQRQHQQHQQQHSWSWIWGSPNESLSCSAACTEHVAKLSSSTSFCESSNVSSTVRNQLATVALVPDEQGSSHSSSSSALLTGLQQAPPERFELKQQQQPNSQWPGQPQQQPPRSSPSTQFASATINGSSGGVTGQQTPGFMFLGRVINGEAGRLLGLLGGQLLWHVANLQRGLAALQQHQQHDAQQQQQQRWRPRLPWQRQVDPALDKAAAAGSKRQQQQQWQASAAARQWVARGIAAEARMELREALACYTNAVTLDPGDVELICRLAKQWSDLTYEEGATVEQIQEVNAKAVEYAERAITMAPKSAGGYMASCVSRGRLALFSDNKTKVRLAKEAQEAARTALSMEPDNDLAHHLMGRWHFEMAQINFVVRQLIRLVYGAALAPGKFEDALMEYETAVKLNPNKLIHRVELGRTHLRLGHKREAYEQLSASMNMEVEDINALLQKEDAELLLKDLQAQFGKSVSWGGFSNASSSVSGSSNSSSGGIAAASTDSSSSSVSIADGGADASDDQQQ